MNKNVKIQNMFIENFIGNLSLGLAVAVAIRHNIAVHWSYFCPTKLISPGVPLAWSNLQTKRSSKFTHPPQGHWYAPDYVLHCLFKPFEDETWYTVQWAHAT